MKFIDDQAGEVSNLVGASNNHWLGCQGKNAVGKDCEIVKHSTSESEEHLRTYCLMRRNPEAAKRFSWLPSSIRQDSTSNRSSSLVKALARRPSFDSSVSTTDSETMSRESSRPPSRGGSSCGNLDAEANEPEVDCPDAHFTSFEWELSQFKEGKVPFGSIASHFERSDPGIRRSVVEAVGMAAPHATMESTGAVAVCLRDSDPFVRRASVKSLCAVVAKAGNSKIVEFAQQTLTRADACIRFDTIDALMQFAKKGSKRASHAMDWYRLQDKDPSIRCKAERSLEVAGCMKPSAIRGAKVAMAHASHALSS